KALAAIDGDRLGEQWGWAIAPHYGKSHTAIFETAAGATAGAGRLLHVRLLQNYGGRHTLGRLRISVTASPRPVFALPPQIAEILAVAADARTPQQQAALSGYFAPIYATGANAEIAELEKKLAAIKPVATPIMRELPPERRRTTHVMVKGNYLTHGEQVQPGVPAAFHALSADAPRNRLGLARWLMHADNPLTARVLVNRYWAQLMGRGIVETEEDFGAMGLPPTHPELLDWLALHVQQQDWSLKALIKTIVMSATYRQSSAVTPELVAKDPRNLYFARGPRFRLSAEQVRDQALALGGILNRQMYGPSVNPPRPFDPISPAFSGDKIRASKGDAARRRGLYTFLRRTNSYPSRLTFDGTSREICTIRRVRTNTPLQALVTLNDPVYVEAAEGLARRIAREGGSSVAERVDFALRLVTCREPEQREVDRLVRLYQRELEHYRSHRKAARQMAEKHLGPASGGVDLAELAAWTVVANVLLNLDEILVRG
ncbi:MAG: DUF1553 domain-containing protein, partial [Planctomycetota bacterium]|nr:DUF1553 domain-containing protein [Planctomycetota bacterium]